MKPFKTILIFLVAFTGVFVAYNFVPLKYFEVFTGEPKVGSTITTILGTDTLSNSRGTINTNFANLNADKIEADDLYGTTTLNLLTTANSLSSVGTITSGQWRGTAVGATWGGTGSTTLSQFSVLLGSSTNPIGMVNGLGTAGDYLTSQGAGLPPIWQTGAINLASDYTWTGGHIWTASSTHSATTTISANSVTNNALVLNGINYAFPSVQGASSTILATNGSGSLTWQEGFVSKFYSNNTNLTYTGSTATSTLLTVPIPANTLNEGTLLEISAFVDGTGSSLDAFDYDIQFGTGSASTTIAFTVMNTNTSVDELKATIKANNSLSSQLVYPAPVRYNDTIILNAVRPAVTTYNNASQLYLSFRGKPRNSGNTIKIYSVLIKKIK